MTMSHATRTQVLGLTGSPRAVAARTGLLTTALAAGVVAYGTYGDPNADSSQKSAMPFLLGIAVAIGLIVFGALAPQAIRAASSEAATGRRWGIGFAVAAVLSLAAFWTGAPVILGTAAAVTASAAPRSTRSRSAVLAVGALAAAITVVWTILSNTVMS